MEVEVVFALPDRQFLDTVTVPDGATVADAIRLSGVKRHFPGIDLDGLQTGIWGKPVGRQKKLRNGDRVELYRPLELDPREARRLKARV